MFRDGLAGFGVAAGHYGTLLYHRHLLRFDRRTRSAFPRFPARCGSCGLPRAVVCGHGKARMSCLPPLARCGQTYVYRRQKSGGWGSGGNVSDACGPLIKFLHHIIDTDNVAAQLEGKMRRSSPSPSGVDDDRRKSLSDLLPSLRTRLHRCLKAEKVEIFLRPDRLPPGIPLPPQQNKGFLFRLTGYNGDR